MEAFQVVHRYRRLVAREAVPPIVCVKCGGSSLVSGMDPYDQPMLHCHECGTKTTIGLKDLMEMERLIKEYDENRKG